MDLIFNELCARVPANTKYQANQWMYDLLKTYDKAADLGFVRIQMEHNYFDYQIFKDYKIIHWLDDENTNKTQKSLFLSAIKYPYSIPNPVDEDEYLKQTFYLVDEAVEAIGLGISYISQTLAISYQSEELWKSTSVDLKKSANQEVVQTKHISSPDHLSVHQLWIESIFPPVLVVSNLDPTQKIIKLSEHHGRDVLLKFSRKIVKSNYVISIINSIPFNRESKDFIKICKSNGLIEIVLTKYDDGFGIILQSTGRNLCETIAISRILEETFFDEQ